MQHKISMATVDIFKKYFADNNVEGADDPCYHFDESKLRLKGTPTWREIDVFPKGSIYLVEAT